MIKHILLHDAGIFSVSQGRDLSRYIPNIKVTSTVNKLVIIQWINKQNIVKIKRINTMNFDRFKRIKIMQFDIYKTYDIKITPTILMGVKILYVINRLLFLIRL